MNKLIQIGVVSCLLNASSIVFSGTINSAETQVNHQRILTKPKHTEHTAPTQDELKKMIAKFVSIPFNTPVTNLPSNEIEALKKLIEASDIINQIYMQQLWAKNSETFSDLAQTNTSLARTALHFYWLNKSPWSELDGKPIIDGVPSKKPKRASFYPEDMSKAEFEDWVKTLDENQQKQAKSFFTVIKRAHNGLEAISYSEVYKDNLIVIAKLLNEAAQLTENESLKKYLIMRAEAFLSNEYEKSDIAWMVLDGPVDVTIGPYETYEDGLFGYKASFEAYVSLLDVDETQKLHFFSNYLQEIEDHLPIPAEYRNPELGASSPIRIVNVIYSSGHGAFGIQSTAYNLPNDEKVITEHGSKRIMLKNTQRAKYDAILSPIAEKVFSAEDMKDLSFNAFFTHILAHELTHGLGPHSITINGQSTTPREALKELYSAIEEAKADVTGLFALQYLLDKQATGDLTDNVISFTERQLYTTYLAEMYRTLRFGIREAHGRGMALQFNYLLQKNALLYDKESMTFSIDWENIKAAIKELDTELLMLEATGNYKRAQYLLDTMAIIPPELNNTLEKLKDIPIDIEPVFDTAKALVPMIIKSGAEFEEKSQK